MVVGSTLTCNASRFAGSPRATPAAALSMKVFHSSFDFPTKFQTGLGGAPIIFCISGLTLVGTGRLRAGVSRGAGVCAPTGGAKRTIAVAAQAMAEKH